MTEKAWASDAIAALLRELNFGYAAIVPGSSFRGLHDSLVNYLKPGELDLLVCLHEEHAVALAHGYAKVTGKPMLVVVHANVGLLHAAMAFYDAWADRVPVVVLGANGPRDAAKRRPWIDWLHSTRDTASIVRGFTKWDDEPGSVTAALESITRAYQITSTPPYAPTYVVLDVAMQEEKLGGPITLPKLERFAPPEIPTPVARDVKRTIEIMRAAKHPVIVSGRISRDLDAWNGRIALAEAFGARVIGDMKVGASFPTNHPLFIGPPSNRPNKTAVAAMREADVILSLDSIDLGGILLQAFGTDDITPTIIACSVDRYLHNGFSMDHHSLPPIDLNIAVPANAFVSALLDELGNPAPKPALAPAPRKVPAAVAPDAPDGEMGMIAFVAGLEEAFAELEVCYIRLPLGAERGSDVQFTHPLDFLGGDGGGGIGAGPGLAVGAALALRGTNRLPVAVLGDGDYLMGLTALWTAVANKIPLLIVIANNRCYYNDVAHQERVAVERDRPVERKWVAQMIDEPAPDMAMLARGQGAIGVGPVVGREAMKSALADAVREVRAGKVVVVDVAVAAERDAPPRT